MPTKKPSQKTKKSVQKKFDQAVRSLVEGLVPPSGFKKVFLPKEDYWRNGQSFFKVLRFEDGNRTTIDIVFTDRPEADYFWGSGHTTFYVGDSKYSYDRRGVDDSFYVENPAKWDVKGDLLEETQKQIDEQAARVLKSKERLARSTPVPGLERFKVTPEERENISEKLKSGRSHTFAPAGFGTGYIIVAKARPTKYGPKPARPEMAEFFGVPKLFISSFDHD